MREIRRIIVHHSGSSRETTVEQINEWHRGRGWGGIGYHWFVDGSGAIRAGRPVDQIGAHAKGANHDSIGICVAGDNTDPEQHWTAIQKATLVLLIRALRTVFGPLEVEGHRWAAGCTTATLCPGLSREEWDALSVRFH